MNNNISNRKFISISSAAKFLGVSPDTLRNWEKQGKITVSRTSGGARRYSRFELSELKKEVLPQNRKSYGLLSVSKTAVLLNISPDTLRNWEAKGLIEGFRTKGGARRFSRSEVKRLQAELGIESQPPKPVIVQAPINKVLTEGNRQFWPHPFKILYLSLFLIFITGSVLAFIMYSNQPQKDDGKAEEVSLQNILGEQTKNLENQIYNLASSLENLQKQFYEFGSQKAQPVVYNLRSTFIPQSNNTSTLGDSNHYFSDGYIINIKAKNSELDSLKTNVLRSLSFSLGDTGLLTGSGMPEAGTGEKGDYYFRNDGSQATDTLYFKTPDGWISLEQSVSLQDAYNKGNEIVIGNDIAFSGDGNTFRVNDDGTFSDPTPFLIDSNGNLGIGSSQPSSKLYISDNRIDGTSGLTVQNNATATPDITVFKVISNVGGALDTKVRIDTDGDLFLDGTLTAGVTLISAGGADLAEEYNVLDDAQAGDLVMSEIGVNVKKSYLPYQNSLIGVISEKPGFSLSLRDENGLVRADNPNPKPIALVGRVPVKVSSENGPIEVGDFLTSSSTPGVAMKALRPGPVIGKALEDFSESAGKIMVFVNISYADPDNFFANLSMDEKGNLIIPKIKTGLLILDQSLSSASAQLSINNNQLAINTDPSYQNPGQQLTSNSNTYFDLSGKIASLEESIRDQDKKITDLEEKIADMEATSSADTSSNSARLSSNCTSLREASLYPVTCNLDLTPPDILLATGSATLDNLIVVSDATVSGMLTSYDFSNSNIFKSLGQTILGSTEIAGDLTLDGTLSLENGSQINVIGFNDIPGSGILFLQKSKLAQSIDIFDGKIIITKEGVIKAPVVIVAEFKIVANKISGSAKISVGQKEIEIENPLVKKTSRILITATSQTDTVLAVTDKIEGKKFVVSSSKEVSKDTEFDYFLINELED